MSKGGHKATITLAVLSPGVPDVEELETYAALLLAHSRRSARCSVSFRHGGNLGASAEDSKLGRSCVLQGASGMACCAALRSSSVVKGQRQNNL